MASVEATSAAKITSTDETNVTEGASNVNGAAVSNLSPSTPPSNEQQDTSLKTTPDSSSSAKNENESKTESCSKTETSAVEAVQNPAQTTAVTEPKQESMEQTNPPNPPVENETPPELPKSEPPQLPPAEEISQDKEIKETKAQPETTPVSQEVIKTGETNEVSENKVLESPAPPTTTPAEPADQPVDLTPLNELIQEQPASPAEETKSQQETKDLAELVVTPAAEEKANETPVTEQPKEQPQEQPQEQPKEQPKEKPQEQPKEQSQEKPQEQSQEKPQEQPQEQLQEQPQETTPDIKETSSTTHVLQKTDSIFNPDRIIEEVTAEGIKLAAQEIQNQMNQEIECPVADSVVKDLDEKIPSTSSGEQQVPSQPEEATTNAPSEAASSVTQPPTETQTSCETEGPKKESEEAKVSDASSPPEEEAKKEPDAPVDSTEKESQEIPTEPPLKEPEVNANPVDESVTCASTDDPSNTSLDVTN